MRKDSEPNFLCNFHCLLIVQYSFHFYPANKTCQMGKYEDILHNMLSACKIVLFVLCILRGHIIKW